MVNSRKMDRFKETLENKRLLSQQFLSCAICIDYLDKPIRTHCLHYFCKKCLDNLFRNSSNPVPCPICKFPINRRNLLECHQLQSIISLIQEINSNMDDDLLSMVEPAGGNLSKTSSELVIKLPIKSATNADKRKGVSNKPNSSNADKEIKQIRAKNIEQKKEESVEIVPNIPTESSDGEKIPVKKLKAPIIPHVESTISSDKVTEWLNEYCISPSNLTPQENCEAAKEICGNISKASVENAENLPIQKSITKQTKKFFRSREQSNLEEDKNLEKNPKDVYLFDSPNDSKKATNNRKTKKSLKSKASIKSKTIEPSSELSIEEDDNVLFQSPVRTVKALKAKEKAKLVDQKCDEPPVLNIKINLTDCSKSNVGKDISESNPTPRFKRKLKSGVHSFSESQLNDHDIERVENFDSNNIQTFPIKSLRNDSSSSSKSLAKAIPKEEKRTCKTTAIKPTECDESSKGKIQLACSFEKLKPDETEVDISLNKSSPIAKPKRKVNFYKLGKILDSEVVQSVACQTDDIILKINGIDVCIQADIAPIKDGKDVGCSPMHIEEEEENLELNSPMNVEEGENLELNNLNIKNDTKLESSVSSNLLTFEQQDEKISQTPSKPAKKRKTIKGLARIGGISCNNTPSFDSETLSKTPVNLTQSDVVVDVVTVSSQETSNNLKSSRKLILLSSNEASELSSPVSFPKVGVSSGSFSKEPTSLDKGTLKKRPKFVPENKPFRALVDSPVKNKKMKKVDVSPIKFQETKKAIKEIATQKEKKSYRRIQTFDDSDSDEISFSETSIKPNLQLDGDNIFGTYEIERSRENATPDSFKDDEVISSTPKKDPSNINNNNKEKEFYDKIKVMSDSENDESEVTITDNRAEVEELDIPFEIFDDEDLLYSATPLKKPQPKLEYSEELNLNDSKVSDFDKPLTESSPLTSILEDVTTQKYLLLKAQIKDLQLQEQQMEEELKVVEVSETSKLNSNLSVIGSVTADQSTSTRLDSSKVLSHHKLINKPTETSNSESGYFGDRDIVSPSPQPQQKWTPSRMINVSRMANENKTAVTSVLNETIKNKVPNIKSSATPEPDKFPKMSNIDKKILQPKNYSFTATGVDPSQMKRVKQLAQVLNGSFKPTFVPNVTTHIIVKVGPNGCCERTFKYLAGIAYGCWIVSIKWVTDSLAAGTGLPEEDYEAEGDNSEGAHGGPTKARLNPIPLLGDFQVLIIEPFKDLAKDQIVGLLEKCGASVASHPSKMDNGSKFQQLILVDKIPPQKVVDQYNDLYSTRGLLAVNRDWLLDSVATYTVKPIQNYNMSPVDAPLSPRLY